MTAVKGTVSSSVTFDACFFSNTFIASGSFNEFTTVVVDHFRFHLVVFIGGVTNCRNPFCYLAYGSRKYLLLLRATGTFSSVTCTYCTPELTQ